MIFRTWPGMAGGLLALLLCGCQSANWFALNREQREPPTRHKLAERDDETRSPRDATAPKSTKETGTRIARTEPALKGSASKTPAEWYTEGAKLETERRFSEARVAYEHAIEADPAFAEAHHRLGVIADRASEFALADRHYNRAHELKPSDPSILSDMGYSQFLRKRDREAERLLKQAVELDPAHVDANGNLAQVYVRQQRYAEALATLSRVESSDTARTKLAAMLPPGAPSVDQIAQQAAPESLSTGDTIRRVADSREMSNEQSRWLEEQMSGSPGEPITAGESGVVHAGGAMANAGEELPVISAQPGRADLPTIEPNGKPTASQSTPKAAPQAPPLTAESGADTRPIPPATGKFWQGTPLPSVEPGAPGMPQKLVDSSGAAPDTSVPRAMITDVTPRNVPPQGDIIPTGASEPAPADDRMAGSRLALLAGFDVGPGSLFPTGVTSSSTAATGGSSSLGMASPWGGNGPAATPGSTLPAWPGRAEQPAGSGVVQAGGTLADWPAANLPVSGSQPRQADPLAAFQHEIDQRAAADRPAPASGGTNLSPQQQPAAGNGLAPWPAPSGGGSPLTAQGNGALQSGTPQVWPPRQQTLQKPIATTPAAPTVAWPSPAPSQPLPAWPTGNAAQ